MSDVDIEAICRRLARGYSIEVFVDRYLRNSTVYVVESANTDVRALLAVLDEERRQRADLERDEEAMGAVLCALSDEMLRLERELEEARELLAMHAARRWTPGHDHRTRAFLARHPVQGAETRMTIRENQDERR
jgi:hypothetical protein